MPTKVSFDFDGVLSRPAVQRFARELIAAGVELWITTMRFTSEADMRSAIDRSDDEWTGNDDLLTVARRLRIPEERIAFTRWQWKSPALTRQPFVWHLDDCPDTLAEIAANCPSTRPIAYRRGPWREECRRALGLD